ncbi:MAG TPA: hypothetical protein VGM46_11235 [Mesorhizobium sp.]
MSRRSLYLNRFAVILSGYLAAVIAAVVVTVFFLFLPTIHPNHADWGSFYRQLGGLPAGLQTGLVVTFPFALPGFLVALALAITCRWRKWLVYSVAGSVNALASLLIFNGLMGSSIVEMQDLLAASLSGGFVGGLAFWAVCGRHIAQWRLESAS